MKFKKNKKGSSLVLILIIMSVLMILGTSMLSLAVSSYKFRALEQNKKTSMYASEAGLDEAYVIMGQFVQKGIEQGNIAVSKYDENFNKLLDLEKEKVLKTGAATDYLDLDLKIKDEKVNGDREKVFEQGYKTSGGVYNGSISDPNVIIDDKTIIGYKDYIQNNLSRLKTELQTYDYNINKQSTDSIAINVDPKINPAGKFVGENLKLSIISTYIHNSISRIIKATYDIKMANYNVQYNLPTGLVKIPKNPIWSKALMLNGDMKINGGKVNIINGDIYVKGRDANIETSGIDLTNKDSKLYSNKNIVTNKNLVLSYTEENKSENVVIDQNVFCRNLLINETAKGANLKIKKSLYTLDDLEINAPNSHIDIAGSYYGVSDGSEGERNNPDNSSSIIINTQDIGNRVDGNNNTLTNNSALTIGKNVYIAGTSYIDLNNIKYQTGESISIVGNYRAYTEALQFTEEYLRSNLKSEENIRYKDDNIIFDYIDPLTLVTKYKEGIVDLSDIAEAVIEQERYITVYLTTKGSNNPLYNSPKTYYSVVYDNKESKKIQIGKTVKIDSKKKLRDKVSIKFYKEDKSLIIDNSYKDKPYEVELIKHVQLNAFDKSNYFEEYSKQFASKNGLSLGEGIHINKDDPSIENIHAGSIFTSQNIGNSITSGNWSIPLDGKIKARSIQLKNQLFYMGLAKDYVALASTTNIDDIDGSTLVADSEYNNIDDKIAPVVTINDNVHFSSLTSKCEEKNGEVVILDTDTNSTHVLGDGARNISGNFSKADLKGIIITNGNIIISGNLNFKGTIICNGDLTFEGAGDKNITYDKAYLENFALKNYKLFKDAFSDVGQYAKDNVSNYLFAKVYNNSLNTGNVDDKFKLINRTKWELIK